MIGHSEISAADLKGRLHRKEINFGGNRKLKIFGRLDCASGKRMKKANRVFFASAEEAGVLGYRPCGHCMRTAYKIHQEELRAAEKPDR